MLGTGSVERTLLSAAFGVATTLDLDLAIAVVVSSCLRKSKSTASGQECPLHTSDADVCATILPTETLMKINFPLLLLVLLPLSLPAQSVSDSGGKPFVIEYYYKTKWGHADEFLQLFKKNHYPLLKKQVELGRMLKVWVDQPRYHTTEDGRWDYRVTIVFKNSLAANEPFDEEMMKKQLWPDQATYSREEQRRFEILDAHWDLPIKNLELDPK